MTLLHGKLFLATFCCHSWWKLFYNLETLHPLFCYIHRLSINYMERGTITSRALHKLFWAILFVKSSISIIASSKCSIKKFCKGLFLLLNQGEEGMWVINVIKQYLFRLLKNFDHREGGWGLKRSKSWLLISIMAPYPSFSPYKGF